MSEGHGVRRVGGGSGGARCNDGGGCNVAKLDVAVVVVDSGGGARRALEFKRD